MTKHENPNAITRKALSRRTALKGIGALVVSIGTPIGFDAVMAIREASAQAADPNNHAVKPKLLPNELDSFISVNADGTVNAYFGKIDVGHGLHTAIGQIVAEELDVPFKAVKVLMGDTDTSVNQGGASGSTGLMMGGKQMRVAAAEARRQLVEMAAQKFGVPPDQITVTDGVCRAGNDAATSVSYSDLLGGQYFNAQLEWNKQMGNALYAPGKAKPKDPKNYKIVGQPIPKEDVAPKVFATGPFITDIRVDGMWHGRMIYPPMPGASIVSVDEATVKNIPNVIVVREKDFIGVVAEKEWNAIKAAQQLKIIWTDPKPPFVKMTELYDHIRKAPERKHENEGGQAGNVDDAFPKAARIIEAQYEWPFQSHASMGGACCVAQIKEDGHVYVWSGSQKPHFVQEGVANALNLPIDKVHAKWITGPGSYGRNDADDAASDAALLAKHSGKPVRVQYMRNQGTGWDPKGPASVHYAKAGLDTDGNVIAYDFFSKGFSRVDVNTNGAKPWDCLAGHLTGVALKSGDGFGSPSESYAFPNKKLHWATIAPLLDRASPLRTSHLRDPVGPQIHFASESFIDELAAATKTDALAFRLKYAKDKRDRDVMQAAATKHGWENRVSGTKIQPGTVMTGRGIAFASRTGTRVAVIAEVEVNRDTGKIWGKRFTVAHDCGQLINPRSMQNTIEGNVIQGISRTVHEEVQFDEKNILSVDWESYPILDILEKPEAVDVVLIDQPEIPMTGAGEPSIRPMAAAIANAVFDATGVRMRRVPFNAQNVKAALAGA